MCRTTVVPAVTSPETSTSTRRTTSGSSLVTTRRPAAETLVASRRTTTMLTNEVQTVTVSGATGGTFTLTFDGQTTAPIPFPLVNTAIEAALEDLANLTDVAVTGNAATNRQVNFAGNKETQDVPLMTTDGSGLTGTTPSATVALATVAGGQGVNIPAEAGLFNAPHVDARRSSANTARPPRQGVADQGQGGRHLGRRGEQDRRRVRGASRKPLPQGTARTRPEVYAHGLPQPVPHHPGQERRRLRDRLLAGLADPPDLARARRAPVASRSCASRRTTAGRCA